MGTLSPGSHKVTLEYTVGSLNTNITVKKAETKTTQQQGGGVSTSDTSHNQGYLWIMLLAGVLGLVAVPRVRKKQ